MEGKGMERARGGQGRNGAESHARDTIRARGLFPPRTAHVSIMFDHGRVKRKDKIWVACQV